MKRILKIGMDVHTTNYTLCAMEPIIGEDDRVFATIKVTPDYKNILMFIENLKMKLGLNDEYDIQCGCEAGCLGYSLYNQLTAAGVKCVILAPTTMLTPQGVRIKTDMRDAYMIAQCLSYGGYHAVYIPTQDQVRKQGGLCTGITQNVVDLLQNYTATTMLANSEFVVLLKQANTDSSKMAEVIGVSEAQLRFVTNTQSGMGLMKCGNVVIPFDNQIEKGTDLYNLYNTNIHEKIALEKSKNAVDIG